MSGKGLTLGVAALVLAAGAPTASSANQKPRIVYNCASQDYQIVVSQQFNGRVIDVSQDLKIRGKASFLPLKTGKQTKSKTLDVVYVRGEEASKHPDSLGFQVANTFCFLGQCSVLDNSAYIVVDTKHPEDSFICNYRLGLSLSDGRETPGTWFETNAFDRVVGPWATYCGNSAVSFSKLRCEAHAAWQWR